MPDLILGWDIGGVACKVAVADSQGARSPYRVISIPYEIRHDASGLAAALAEATVQLGVDPCICTHAVTMTAELSRAFRTKREGVAFVLAALEAVVGDAPIEVFTTDGRFIPADAARAAPLLVAAANWMATASFVARSVPSCVLVDIGSTSTDIIPIVNGQVVAIGRTDPERLLHGELVYTGALRTPIEALVSRVPLWGSMARVAAEGFATTADVYIWLRRLDPNDCAGTAASGCPANRAEAGDHLARAVCADREMVEDASLDAIANAILRAQTETIAEAIGEVRARHAITKAVVTGLGDFIAVEACSRAGLPAIRLADELGAGAQVAPAVAVAALLREARCHSS